MADLKAKSLNSLLQETLQESLEAVEDLIFDLITNNETRVTELINAGYSTELIKDDFCESKWGPSFLSSSEIEAMPREILDSVAANLLNQGKKFELARSLSLPLFSKDISFSSKYHREILYAMKFSDEPPEEDPLNILLPGLREQGDMAVEDFLFKLAINDLELIEKLEKEGHIKPHSDFYLEQQKQYPSIFREHRGSDLFDTKILDLKAGTLDNVFKRLVSENEWTGAWDMSHQYSTRGPNGISEEALLAAVLGLGDTDTPQTSFKLSLGFNLLSRQEQRGMSLADRAAFWNEHLNREKLGHFHIFIGLYKEKEPKKALRYVREFFENGGDLIPDSYLDAFLYSVTDSDFNDFIEDFPSELGSLKVDLICRRNSQSAE